MAQDAKQRLESLEAQLRSLEAVSDDTLCEMLYDHLRSNSGRITIEEFSSQHSIPVRRIEEVLDKLCSEGYIARKK